ncbi:heparan sulfate 2-O-sulfotransferase pipe-like [Teleopsis dalmanni]|uniref:heparan sulfate 2-O-sulfotransferase pipe-like n=1 Tax=Teleopsis dalmanni TaxID=139649 RepID=UPI0018CDDF6D|nr:heparan sulfate 2-O-sulfotransferase pipe-like [Teleopsis dalmanni]
MALMNLLGKQNGYGAHRDKPSPIETVLLSPLFEINLIEEIMEKEQPATYSKHVAYIDFAANDYAQPIYINMVRDPIERLISWFYYIRAPWYIAERKKRFAKSYKLPNVQWLKKTFNKCILEHDDECLFEQGEERGLGDHRRQMLFFCGQDTTICMPFNSYEAMQISKQHVESNYAVVGTWEETNITLKVLEHYIPRFFKGATDVYYHPENNLHKVNRNTVRPTVSPEHHSIHNVRNRHHIDKELVSHNHIQHHKSNNVQNQPRLGNNELVIQAPNTNEPIKSHHKTAKREKIQVDKKQQFQDDDYDLEDDEWSLKADLLNNTKKAEVDVIFFNRVPKVGSQSLMELMVRLGNINGYSHSRDAGKATETILLKPDNQRELIAEIYMKNKPHAYSQHIAYINFTRFHFPKPIYINLVRDPIERIISWHYYVRAEWYYKDLKDKLGDKAPDMPEKEFMEMDFETCVKTGSKYCQFNQMQVNNPAGDHRRQTLFFCGQNKKLCMPFNSAAAMQKAKRTVEEDYAVVGTWEDTNITLSVLEHYIPKFFKHAKVAYYLFQNRLSSVNKNSVKKTVSEEARAIIRKNLTNEIEFYEFCKQRLYLQYAAISGGEKIDNDDYLLLPEHNDEGDYEY